MNNKDIFSKLTNDALSIRRTILKMACDTDGGHHIGGALSMVEIMCYLYGHHLNISPSLKHSPERDRFILSKGHGVLGFYPILHHYSLISNQRLATYKQPGSELISHPIQNLENGIESSNGSLGHGLSYAAGVAFGLKVNSSTSTVVTLIGDGECNEGSIWEAAMSASALKLENLTLIVDCNGHQSDTSSSNLQDLSELPHKFTSFGWYAIDIDGHDYSQIQTALLEPSFGKPKAIVAKTIKGKGVKDIENDNTFHHAYITEAQYLQLVDGIY